MIEKLMKSFDAFEWVLLLIIAGCIFLLGLKLGYMAGDAKAARLETQQASAEHAALKSAVDRLEAAKTRADTLETQLAQANAARDQQALEHSHEIARLTRRVPCLNAGTVRLLNQSRGIEPAAVPESAGRTVAEDAAAATDTDVASWIDHAVRQYDTCRDRLGALIDFHQGE